MYRIPYELQTIRARYTPIHKKHINQYSVLKSNIFNKLEILSNRDRYMPSVVQQALWAPPGVVQMVWCAIVSRAGVLHVVHCTAVVTAVVRPHVLVAHRSGM